MAGEGLIGVFERLRETHETLRRTTDPEEREALYARQERDYGDLRRATNKLKAAAEAGDSVAKTILKTLRDEFSEDEDESRGPTG